MWRKTRIVPVMLDLAALSSHRAMLSGAPLGAAVLDAQVKAKVENKVFAELMGPMFTFSNFNKVWTNPLRFRSRRARRACNIYDFAEAASKLKGKASLKTTINAVCSAAREKAARKKAAKAKATRSIYKHAVAPLSWAEADRQHYAQVAASEKAAKEDAARLTTEKEVEPLTSAEADGQGRAGSEGVACSDAVLAPPSTPSVPKAAPKPDLVKMVELEELMNMEDNEVVSVWEYGMVGSEQQSVAVRYFW